MISWGFPQGVWSIPLGPVTVSICTLRGVGGSIRSSICLDVLIAVLVCPCYGSGLWTGTRKSGGKRRGRGPLLLSGPGSSCGREAPAVLTRFVWRGWEWIILPPSIVISSPCMPMLPVGGVPLGLSSCPYPCAMNVLVQGKWSHLYTPCVANKVITHNGNPLTRMWTMQYKAKHRYFKRWAYLMGNHINISKSLADHYQLYLSLSHWILLILNMVLIGLSFTITKAVIDKLAAVYMHPHPSCNQSFPLSSKFF